MKTGDLKESKHGVPAYVRPGDEHEFVLGSGMDLAHGSALRTVPLQDQWQLANMTYRTGAQLVVTDHRGKDVSLRMWRVTVTQDKPGRGVVLEPLHEGGSFFRGGRAYAVEPLSMVPGMKAVVSHITAEAEFDRLSAASATGKSWAEVSKTVSLLHHLGFLEKTGETRTYGPADEAVQGLKSPRERMEAQGPMAVFRKTELWAKVLVPQFEAFLRSKEKVREVDPRWSEPEADGGDGLEGAGGGDVLDEQAEGPDHDVRAGVGVALAHDALPVDVGPVQAPQVPDQDILP